LCAIEEKLKEEDIGAEEEGLVQVDQGEMWVKTRVSIQSRSLFLPSRELVILCHVRDR